MFLWNAITDFMFDKYSRLLFFLNKRLYEYYPQRPVRFVYVLANPSEQTYFFNGASFYLYYLLLVLSFLFNVCIFPKYWKYITASGAFMEFPFSDFLCYHT